jgi:hypothetical protein
MDTTQFCKYCNSEHPLTAEFWNNLKTKPGCKKYQKDWREKNKEYRAEQHKEWREKNAEKHRQSARDHYYANKERKNKQSRAYHKNNREKINKRRKVWIAKVENRLAQNLRVRLVMAIRRESKKGSAVKDLGCSIPELKLYLENRFQPGMTWDNYGSDWHIDHIRPLANYDLTDREVLKQLVHYTNLQPMWAIDNIKKSNKE